MASIEQQTTGAFSPQRALTYQLRFVQAMRREKGDAYPVVVCTIVLFSNQMLETQTTDLFAGLRTEDRQMARQYLGTIFPVELGKIPEEELNDGSACGVLEILLRHRRGTQMLPTLKRLTPSLQRMKKEADGPEFIEAVMSYCFPACLENERRDMIQYVKEHLGSLEEEITMTVGTALKREGLQEGLLKGRQEGREEVAFGMLREGLSLDIVKKVTHLSTERMTKLLAKLEHKTGEQS